MHTCMQFHITATGGYLSQNCSSPNSQEPFRRAGTGMENTWAMVDYRKIHYIFRRASGSISGVRLLNKNDTMASGDLDHSPYCVLLRNIDLTHNMALVPWLIYKTKLSNRGLEPDLQVLHKASHIVCINWRDVIYYSMGTYGHVGVLFDHILWLKFLFSHDHSGACFITNFTYSINNAHKTTLFHLLSHDPRSSNFRPSACFVKLMTKSGWHVRTLNSNRWWCPMNPCTLYDNIERVGYACSITNYWYARSWRNYIKTMHVTYMYG